ncbi:MAG TPA: cation:proton antiporter [Euryarchaeota archaeon]|nr:cation:proton antiporter [Euryarchaeota archaeon]
MFEELWEEMINDLWFQMTLLLTIALMSNFLFSRLGQPKIIGQIVLGIIIGPSVLGILGGQEIAGEMVQYLAKFGAIILLFMIGLECDTREIYTKKSILIALGGVGIPWVVGFFLAELMLGEPEAPLDKFTQSIFVGAALVATSVAIAAGVMREMGIIQSSTAKTILGAAVVDDVLGMIVLAVSAGTAKGESVGIADIGIILIAAVLFVVLGIIIGSRFLSKLISDIERRGLERGMEESGFLLALSLALLYAFIAELVGISAIVGAFVAGTSFGRCRLRKKVYDWTTVLEAVFAPIFFLSLGILVNIRLPLEIWLFAIVLTAGAMISKIIGCGIPARLLGMSKNESISIGIGMSPRLEVAMVIALYGLTANIINEDVYSVIIIMGVLTALFTPSILRRTMKDIPKNGREPVGAVSDEDDGRFLCPVE